MKKLRLHVSGLVQGVGFRYSVYTLALNIGELYGRVWNNEDGSVEILVQSDNSYKLANFIQGIQNNPSRFAKVDKVKVSLTHFDDYTDFRVHS